MSTREPLQLLIRPYEPRDAAGVVAVYEQAFGRWPPYEINQSQAEYLEWFREDHGHFQGLPTVADEGGRVVGCRTPLRRPVLVRGTQRLAHCGGSGVAVEESKRGQGVYTAFDSWLRERYGFELMCGFSQVANLRRVADRTAVPLGNELSVFVRVLRPRRAAARHPGKRWLTTPLYWALQLVGAVRGGRGEETSGLAVRAVDRFDAGSFADLWAETAPAWDFIPVRDAEFLNWRFLDERPGRFNVLECSEGDRLLGYLAYKMADGRGRIADLLVRPGRHDALRALLDEAIEQCRLAGADAVECALMRHHPYVETLRRSAFVRMRGRSAEETRKLFVRAVGLDAGELAFLAEPDARMHIVFGDAIDGI